VTKILSPFELLFFCLFSTSYSLNKNPVPLAILELFTVVCKFKMPPHDLVLDLCDLVLHPLIVHL